MSAATTPMMTDALRQVLDQVSDPPVVADLMFLDAWERNPQWVNGFALRIGQLRRANPTLAAAIRAEVARR